MSWLVSLWEELQKPEDFSDDLYKFCAVALAKSFIGLSVASFVPVGLTYTLILTLAYLVLWEVLVQGWRRRDTLEDTTFFFVGATGIIWLIWVTLLVLVVRRV